MLTGNNLVAIVAASPRARTALQWRGGLDDRSAPWRGMCFPVSGSEDWRLVERRRLRSMVRDGETMWEMDSGRPLRSLFGDGEDHHQWGPWWGQSELVQE